MGTYLLQTSLATNCECLVEKMSARIRTWSSINLSYSRRVQLINFVLLSIHVYWAQVYVLPRSMMESIEKVCRVFLWSDDYNSQKLGYVSWEKVCCPKSNGGLGIQNIQSWNLATMGRFIGPSLQSKITYG